MNETRDLYLRAHTVVLDQTKKRPSRGRNTAPSELPKKWPEYALVFGCESRTGITQELTFGFYRVLKFNGDTYTLEEEGGFFDDDLPVQERGLFGACFRVAVSDKSSFPPNFPRLTRSDFITRVFYRYARQGALLVGFDLPYAFGRLARRWTPGDQEEWSLVLSVYPDGNENAHDPRVLITPLDSKKAFIRFRQEWVPKDGKSVRTNIWKSRFLDLRTLVSAEFGQPLSLKAACELKAFEKFNLPQESDYTPSGQVTVREIEEGRQNVRCMAALLNATMHEFDFHPINRPAATVFSPASFVKGYFDEMGLVPPSQKFDVPNEILGYAMESFSAGRAETKIRHVEVPVAPLDFMSEYPTVAALMDLMEILRAKKLTFEDATSEVQSLVASMSLHRCFKRRQWRDFRFFALVEPAGDVFPVRTMHSGFTQSVGNDYLTDKNAIWMAGPDVINSVLQTDKAPRILRAIRLVPHGKQKGLKPVRLRGTVRIHPGHDDIFRKVIEERRRHKDDKELYQWLKLFANSIYGCFIELNPETLSRRKAARVRVYSGEKPYVTNKRTVVERPGNWYAPYLAALITAGGRLLLGMLERCVEGWGGTYAWADTDALAVVSNTDGGTLQHVPGCESRRILPRSQVQEIVDRFAELNPYNFGGSILRFVDSNYIDSDPEKGFRKELLAFCISAKRYTTYERDGKKIIVIDPKGHGLGYLYPPADSLSDVDQEIPHWVYEAWEWLVRRGCGLLPNRPPAWFKYPQMMRMAVTSYGLLKRMLRLKRLRPFGRFFVPVVAAAGQPGNVDPRYYTLVTPFEPDQSKWIDAVCFNIDDPHDTREYKLATAFDSRHFGERAIVETFEGLLQRYFFHPESKSLGPDGEPCQQNTRGRLRRPYIIGGKHHHIGKEVDRRWEEGDDLDAMRQTPIEYTRKASRAAREPLVQPSPSLSRSIKNIGIRKLIRQGFGRRIIEKISRREQVKVSTYREYERRIEEYARRRKRPKRSL
jgi:hypothetical protein